MSFANFLRRVCAFPRLRRMGGDRRGVTAVEFALIAPVLVALYLGSVELSFMMAADRKVTTASSALGDLTARSLIIDDAEMDAIFEAARLIFQPLDVNEARLRISSLQDDQANDQTLVLWSDVRPALTGQQLEDRPEGVFLPHEEGGTIEVPDNVIIPNGTVIYAEVEFDFDPPIGLQFTADRTLRNEFFLRPRRTDSILRNRN